MGQKHDNRATPKRHIYVTKIHSSFADKELYASVSYGWRGGLVVGRRTCDLIVGGSRPGRDAAA